MAFPIDDFASGLCGRDFGGCRENKEFMWAGDAKETYTSARISE